jgi:hypothetical protein
VIAAQLENYDGLLCERCGGRRFGPRPEGPYLFDCIECHWTVTRHAVTFRMPPGSSSWFADEYAPGGVEIFYIAYGLRGMRSISVVLDEYNGQLL